MPGLLALPSLSVIGSETIELHAQMIAANTMPLG